MTTLTAPAAEILVQGIAPDVVQSCILDPEPPAAPEDTGDELFVPVAPGITPEVLPEAPAIIDTSPDAVIGCINDTGTSPQSRLNALFPAAVEGDGVIERTTNDFWVKRSGVWENVGPTPGPTMVVESLVPVWNETVLLAARTRTKLAALSLAYGLELETVVNPLVTRTGITAQSVKLMLVPAGAVSIAAAAPRVAIGAALRVPAGELLVAAEAPVVVGGGSAVVPAAEIAVAPAVGPTVLRPAISFNVPSVDVSVSAAAPTVAGGASVAIPAKTISMAGTAPEVIIVAPPVFKALTYTGNGSTLTVSGVGFKPGIVWTKRRTGATGEHALYEKLSGTTKYASPSTTGSQTTDANSLTAFNSDGFSLGSASISNVNSASYIAWCWPEGGAAQSNTDGTITTSVSVDTLNKTSVFTYTGNGAANATIGHGLGERPDLVILFRLNTTGGRPAGSHLIGDTQYLSLNVNNARTNNSFYFNGYSSTTISLGTTTNGFTNVANIRYMGIALKSVAGKSIIDAFTGSGSTDNAITCGFAPQFVLIKSYSTAGDWMYFDTARGATKQIIHTNAEETTVDKITFDANGFTVKAGQNTNTSGVSYLYMAFR